MTPLTATLYKATRHQVELRPGQSAISFVEQTPFDVKDAKNAAGVYTYNFSRTRLVPIQKLVSQGRTGLVAIEPKLQELIDLVKQADVDALESAHAREAARVAFERATWLKQPWYVRALKAIRKELP